MRVFTQVLTMMVSLLFGNPFVHAQITNDPSGHWEGTITMPMGELRFEVDLTRDAEGKLSGTLGIPAQKLRGLPLSTVAADDASVSFAIRGGQGGSFRGTLSGDGRTITGSASSSDGQAAFELSRTGEAHLLPAPKSARIDSALEGTWSGTLDVRGGMRVVARLANQPDGSASGLLISVDEGNLEVAVAIVQQGTRVRLDAPMLGSSYAATLNAAAGELAGTYTTSQGLALPLTLKRDGR